MGRSSGGTEDARHEIVEDQPVNLHPVRNIGGDRLDPKRGKALGVDIALDQPARAEKTNPTEPQSRGLLRHRVGNVQPWERAGRLDQRPCLMDGVVGTDQKIRAGLGQNAGRAEHQVGNTGHIARRKARHIGSQRRRMHRDFGVVVARLVAKRSVAKGRSFGGAAHNADMLGQSRQDGDQPAITLPFWRLRRRSLLPVPCRRLRRLRTGHNPRPTGHRLRQPRPSPPSDRDRSRRPA